MITKNLLDNESGLTVALETIILFSISVIFLGMIFYTFHDMSQKQNKVMIEEELRKIGNSMANKMTDMIIEASASKTTASMSGINIVTEFWIPDRIGDVSYTVKLFPGKIVLESSGDPFVSVEVPVGSVATGMNLAENHTIYSTDEKHTMVYDSKSSTIYFENGGAIPDPDFNSPTITIDAPAEGTNISNYTFVNTTPNDETCLSRVEFYVDDAGPKYSAGSPWKWYWDTKAYPDGNHTVMAIAYDCAGHRQFATRNFTIYNPFMEPPVIAINSPPDLSETTFHRPVIKATITDDIELDFSGFILTVDGFEVTANATFNNLTPPPVKKTEISYIPSADMSEAIHEVRLSAKDLQSTPVVSKNWSFNVTAILDADYPTARIVSPTNSTYLSPGTSITISYNASDPGSGLDNMTVNVRRGDGVVYTKFKQISKYPDIVYDIPPEILTLNSTYVAGMNYTYNITVFDRSGKSVYPIPSIGPLNMGQGQAGQLEVITSGNYTSNSGTRLRNITIRDNVSDGVTPVITKINISWVTNSSERIQRVRFGGTDYWNSNMYNNSQVDISDYTTSACPPCSFVAMDLYFSADVRGKTFTLVFQLGDSTSRTVYFKVVT
jgi:hypothetical protein